MLSCFKRQAAKSKYHSWTERYFSPITDSNLKLLFAKTGDNGGRIWLVSQPAILCDRAIFEWFDCDNSHSLLIGFSKQRENVIGLAKISHSLLIGFSGHWFSEKFTQNIKRVQTNRINSTINFSFDLQTIIVLSVDLKKRTSLLSTNYSALVART